MVDSSGTETEEDRRDVIDAMPESLRESLNVSASVEPEECKIVCRSRFANLNLTNVHLERPIQITLF